METAAALKDRLMGITMQELKVLREVWPKLPEFEQEQTIDRIERQVEDAVKAAIRLFTSNGFASIAASIDSITVKDGLKVTAIVGRIDPARHELIDAQGSVCTLVIADWSEFTDSKHSFKAAPQQSEMRLDNEIDRLTKRQPRNGDGDLPAPH